MEDGNTRQQFSSVLCLSGELRCSLSEFNSSKNRQPRQTSGVEIRVVNCLKQRESYLLGGQYKT